MTDPTPIGKAVHLSNRVIIKRLIDEFAAGRDGEALAEIEALLAGEENHPAALYGLALMALRHKMTLPALNALHSAHTRDPGESIYAEALAVLYALAGNLAVGAYFAKLSASLGFDSGTVDLLPPAFPPFAQALQIIRETPYLHQANRLAVRREYPEAIQQYELHLAFFPEDTAAPGGLARCLLHSDQPARAIANLSDLRNSERASAADLSLLGRAYAALGEAEAAETCHLEAIEREPDNLEFECARLADALFDSGRDEAALIELARDRGGRVFSNPQRRDIPALNDRRIRIGYLAQTVRDPRDLDVLATVAASSDPQRFEIFVYGHGSIDDPSNARMRGCHDEWCDISDCDAPTLAATIEGDAIDILVDIGGHAAPLHFGALALRPAPRQVAWLGNPVTLGLSAINVELTAESDPESDPESGGPSAPRRHALPFGLYCYEMFGKPPVREKGRSGPVTFGADLAFAQLHPDLLECWAALLERVPGSVLALRDRTFVEGGLADRLIELFGAKGFSGRVDVIALDAPGFYREIDIALAPFVAPSPHDAVAALTAGVPVVALAGAGRHRRQISDLLHHVGLDALVATDTAGYIALAARLAGSEQARLEAGAAIAAGLADSAVFDPVRFATAFDTAMLEIIGAPGV
ncbi:MAG: hypothetical protein WCF85_10250 [Rhodospirillaceae bacterium]